MKKALSLILCLIITGSMLPRQLFAQSMITMVVGMVGTAQGAPVSGIRIAARDISGRIISETTTDSRGHYMLRDLTPGRYLLTLDPVKTPFKGQSVASAVGNDGLTVNWIVSSGAQALATAKPGTTGAGLFGLSPQATGALLFLGGVSTMFGVAAGVGAFDSPKNNRPVTSPSS